ncbi:Subtilase family protein [Candida albicans]|uniref:Subtilase family protein n=1 Tax=Candida albicans TaxID=5476 RepID=A0A8H6BRW6_CANAX|nr:Subtilase family protein [Candida albicans]
MLPIKLLIFILGYLLSPTLQQYQQIPPRDYENKNYFLVELNTTNSQKPLIDFISHYRGHYNFEHQLSSLDNHYVFSIDKSHPHNSFLGNHNSNEYNLMKRQLGHEQDYDELISYVESIHLLPMKKLSKRIPVPIEMEDVATDEAHQKLIEIAKKLDIHDPEFTTQWHLINLKYPGHDVNVTGLWLEDILGQGIVTALVDDGVDAESDDIKQNFNSEGSWDFNNKGKSPLPRLFDDYHGTRCAGEIAAVKNDVCGIGVAWKSQVSGIRILSGPITSSDEAEAMVYGLDTNDIYSCSWGPTDNGKVLSEPDVIVKKAMIKGIQEGRDKKGAIYVFASGNGGRFGDSCNFDGYTNSIYSITVGAIDYKGLHPQYSEACSAVMVVTYSSGSGEHIHTTDIKKKCSATHGGTSAAAPLASGIYSLILSANPNLTWRDVQYISVLSATPINEEDGNYQTTALNRKYSHKYGYGKTDAYKMVHFAKTWKIIHSSVNVSEKDLKIMNVERVEHITVKVNMILLIEVDDLATFRVNDASTRGFQNWTFMSVAHWGETGIGEWKVEVFVDDSKGDQVEINFKDWQFRIFGESIDGDKAEVYDITKDYAAIRRELLEKEKQNSKSTTTTSSTTTATTTKNKESTTKVDNSASITTSQTASLTSSNEQHQPTESNSDSDSDTDDENKQEGEEDNDNDNGNKKANSDNTGFYLMSIAVVGFIAVLLVMKFHKTPGSGRRRRRRDGYEFDIIPGEDYSDSDDDEDDSDTRRADEDSFDLGHRNDQRVVSASQQQRQYDRQQDEARDRLFDDFNAESLPDYENDMFKIGDEEEEEEEGQQSAKAPSNSEGNSGTSTKKYKDNEADEDHKDVVGTQ